MNELQGRLAVGKTLIGIFLPDTGEPVKDYLSGEIHATLEPLEHKSIEYEAYAGSYDVDISEGDLVLSTKDKLMTSDITIHGMSYVEEVNATGGQTVTIGGG